MSEVPFDTQVDALELDTIVDSKPKAITRAELAKIRVDEAVPKGREEDLREASKYMAEAKLQLTPRQKEFITLWFGNGNNAAKAVRTMGLSKPVAQEMLKLLRSPRGQLFLIELKKKAIEEAQLTPIEVIAKARKVYDAAMAASDFSNALRAADLLGKYQGMNVDRSEHTIRSSTHTSGDTPKEVKGDLQKYKDILAKAVADKKVVPISKES